MSKLKIKLTTMALSVAGALLLLPAAGQAAVNFGSRLTEEPANSGECMALGACTLVSFIHPSDPNGDPYAGGAPIDGVITKFRIRAFPEGGSGTATATFVVSDIERPNPADESTALAVTTGTGPTLTIPEPPGVDTPILEVGGRLPVKKGQHLGVNASPNLWATKNNSGDEYSYVFAPPLVEGSGKRGSTQSTGELLVAATIEPDADKDGFGDETQDLCATQATTQGACDVTKPGVSGFKVSGDQISYTLSEAATVSFKLEKKFVGRKAGKKCVKRTAANKKKKKCSQLKQVGAAFSGGGAAGANTATLPNGKKLKPGTYLLTMTARDAAGNETTATTTFTVKKKKKPKRK